MCHESLFLKYLSFLLHTKVLVVFKATMVTDTDMLRYHENVLIRLNISNINKDTKKRHSRRSGAFIVSFEYILHIFIGCLLSTLNK